MKTMDNIPIMIGFVEHEGAFELLGMKFKLGILFVTINIC